MKALSVRQPWAWLIVNGYKDIENRSWNTKYRGMVLIHASARIYREDYLMAQEVAAGQGITLPALDELQKGGIVGYTYITGCSYGYDKSPWFIGPVGFHLSGSKPLPFLPLKGRLNFFESGYGVVSVGRNETLIRERNVPGVNT